MRADSVKELHCHCQGHEDFQLDQTNWWFTNFNSTLASGRLLHLVVKFRTAYLSAVVAHHLDRDRWEKWGCLSLMTTWATFSKVNEVTVANSARISRQTQTTMRPTRVSALECLSFQELLKLSSAERRPLSDLAVGVLDRSGARSMSRTAARCTKYPSEYVSGS